VALASLLGLVLPSLMCRRPLEDVPIRLQGIWRSDTRPYEDRFLSISKRSITFGTGGTDALVLGVVGVESAPQGWQETRYRFHVIDAEGDPDEVVVYHRQESPLPSLRLANQEVLWRPHTRRPWDAP
jgi:hypothetical protein